MNKNTKTIVYVAGALLLGGVVYGWLQSKKEEEEKLGPLKVEEEGGDPVLLECGLRLSSFSGLMDVPAEVAKYPGQLSCLKLIDDYVQNRQAQEYAKLVAEGKMNEDQAKASLTIDVNTVNMALNMLETA